MQRQQSRQLKIPHQKESKPKTLVQWLVKTISTYTVGKEWSLDEVLNIVRPAIYVWAVIKFGRKSYTPIKIAAVLDITQFIIGRVRLHRSHQCESKADNLHTKKQHFVLSSTEKNELWHRTRSSVLKYLVRDPIFTQFTKPMIEKYLGKTRVIPQAIISYLIAYINYFRFYSYIA